MIGLQDLRDFLNITEADGHATDDLLENELEPAALAIVQNWSGFTYPQDAAAIVEYVRGNGGAELFLHFNPTADPTEVLERPNVGDTGTAIDPAASNGWVRRGTRLVRKGSAVWYQGHEYQVTYAGGYVPDTEPADVRVAIMQIVSVLYNQRGQSGLKRETIGKYSYELADAGGDSDILKILEALPRRGVLA